MSLARQARGGGARRGLHGRPQRVRVGEPATRTTCWTSYRRRGSRALAAWCAFVLQTHADNLLASGSSRRPSASSRPTTRLACSDPARRRAGSSARSSALSSADYRLDVVVPQPFPRPYGAHRIDELRGDEARRSRPSQARAGTAIEARRGEPVVRAPAADARHHARRARRGDSFWPVGHTPEPSVELALGADAPRRRSTAGIRPASCWRMPELLAKAAGSKPPVRDSSPRIAGAPSPRRPRVRPVVPDRPDRAAAPGDHRQRLRPSSTTSGRSDPEPEQTARDPVGDRWRRSRTALSTTCPTEAAGSLQAVHVASARGRRRSGRRTGSRSADRQFDEGDRFVLSAGGGDEPFRRAIVRLSARAAARLRRGRRGESPLGTSSGGSAARRSRRERARRSFSFGPDGRPRSTPPRRSSCSTGSGGSSGSTPRCATPPIPRLRGDAGARSATSCSGRTRPRRSRRRSGRPTPGVPYFAYDPALRVLATVEPVDGRRRRRSGAAATSRSPSTGSRVARFELGGEEHALELYWLDGVRRRALRPVPRRDVGRRDLRRRALPARHGQGLRPRHGRRPARARLQLRLQPVVQLRPALGLPALAAGEPAAGRVRAGERMPD